jgi:hypothetical protein
MEKRPALVSRLLGVVGADNARNALAAGRVVIEAAAVNVAAIEKALRQTGQ